MRSAEYANKDEAESAFVVLIYQQKLAVVSSPRPAEGFFIPSIIKRRNDYV